MEIYTLAIDLKIQPDGQVRILEIMSSNCAGFSGYKKATGNDMLRDSIFPDLEGLGRPFVYMEPGGAGYDECCQKLEDSDLNGILYLPQHRVIDKNRRSLIENSRHSHINANRDFLALCDSKAAFHLYMEGDVGEELLLPPTYVGASSYRDDLAEEIRVKIGTHGLYVLKAPDTACGVGLRLIKDQDLDDTLAFMFSVGEERDCLDTKVNHRPASCDYWHTEKSPVFVIQPFVPGKIISKGREDYDGTMRVTLTALRENENKPFSIIMHDGYWKLPEEPVKEELSESSVVSYAYGNWEKNRTGVLARVFNWFAGRNPHKPKDTYLAVDVDDKEEVFQKLEEIMPGLMERVCSFDLSKKTQEWLFSEDDARIGTGLLLASSLHYSPYGFNSTVHDNDGDEGVVLEYILSLLQDDHKARSSVRYIETLANYSYMYGQVYRTALPSSMLKKIEKERIDKIKALNVSAILYESLNI